MASSVASAKAAAASMPSGAGAPRAMGVDRVPYDNYLIRAHEGEKLLTKREANQYDEVMNTRGVPMVSRAMGTGEIRDDNTPIMAHEGEKLLTAQETRQQESGSGGINLSGMVINVAGSIVGYEGLEDLTDNIVEVMSRKLSKVAANMA